VYNGHMYNWCIKILCSLYLKHVKICTNHTLKNIHVYSKYRVKTHYDDSLWGIFGSSIIVHTI